MLWAVPQQYQNRPPTLSLSIDATHLKPIRSSEDAVECRVLQLIELVGGLIEETRPAVGYGAVGNHLDDGGLIGERPAETVLDAQADLVHWFTYLPLSCVERIGREQIREAPAWHVAELDTGGVTLVASGQPLFGGQTERQQIADWLGFTGPDEREMR